MNIRLKISLFSALLFIVLLGGFYVVYEYKEADSTKRSNQIVHNSLVPQLRLLEQMRFGIIRIVSSTSEHLLVGLTYAEGAEDVTRRTAESIEENEINRGHRAFLKAYTELKGILTRFDEGALVNAQELEQIHLHYDQLQRTSTNLINLMQAGAENLEIAESKEEFEEQEQVALNYLAEVLVKVQKQADIQFAQINLSINNLGNNILFLGVVLIGLMLLYSTVVLQLLRKEAQARASAEELAAAHLQEVEERKRIESLLASHQKLEALGTMLGGIAHSVNNFLTPIIALSKMLKLDHKEDHETYADLKRIENSASSASEVLKNVLAFSRNRQRDVDDSTEIVGCIHRSLLLAKAAMPSTARLTIEIEPDEVLVPCKEADIETLLLNLIGNSVDALEGESGDISVNLSQITITPDQDFDNSVHLEPGNYVNLSITDTGHGISTDIIENLFDPFFTTKEVGQGSGLGLSVSYSIVKQAGGQIRVKSEQGEKTCFDIFLPILNTSIDGDPALEEMSEREENFICR
ncbi:ATP-binding protein [uncultured Neptuniibacter sp.]|uniref:sensor histidine kinase n=1 Tax=uncultured Neptuniibacter sp. TaxID=502143 RepID=UPI00260ADFB2|nr:ATP-binding protein [uncultured Neptuniibacter sp.]